MVLNKTVYRLCGADVVCVLDDMGITMTPEQVRDYFVAAEERAKALAG